MKYPINAAYVQQSHRTICEVLREMHRMSVKHPDMLALIEEAHDYAKRMDEKLKEYATAQHPSRLWDAGFWDKVK